MRIPILRLAFLTTVAAAGWAQSAPPLITSADRKFASGDYSGALEDYEQALAAAVPDSADAAALSLEVAKVLGLQGDFTGSRALGQRALAIYERTKGAADPAVARALDAIAFALHGAGDYMAAKPIFERALAIDRAALGPENRETIEILERLAFNYSRTGDYATARAMQEQALAACEKAFGEHDATTDQALRVLSQMLTELGDYPSAEPYQKRALAGLEEQRGKDAVEVGDTLLSMGNAAKGAGQYEKARGYFTRALAIYEKRLGPRNTRAGGALDSLGAALLGLKRFDEARDTLNRALDIQTEELGPEHPWTANVIQGLAKVETAVGNYAKARDLFEQNLKIWRDHLGPMHPFTVMSTMLLSDVLAHLGNYREAIDTALNAADIRRQDILLTVRTVDERQALRYADLHTTSMDTALTLASRNGSLPDERARAWDALIQSRALVLDEMSARHRSIQQSRDPAVADVALRVAGARSQLSRLILQGPGKSTPAEYTAKADRSRAELAQAEESLALLSAEFRRELEMRRTRYDGIRAALPVGSALVAFRRYNRKNYGARSDQGTESYVAFVLAGPRAEPVAVRLGSAAHIEDLVKKWRAEIERERNSLGRSSANNEASYRQAGEALRAAIWDPLAARLGGARRVFIVPDGSLQVVNFSSLPTAGGRYLVESGPLLHLLSAERDLAAPLPERSATGLLAVGAPDFQSKARTAAPSPVDAVGEPLVFRGAPSACGGFAALKFAALPASLEEIQTIQRIWKSRGWQETSLTGADASEAAVKGLVAGNRVVHFATHGFFLSAECPETFVARENPLLRSGLALAGANLRQTAGSGGEDGILTGEEAATLDLEGTEWVVLSGCDTGAGDIRAGEGVMGLRRAFEEAGARTVINSLWPVEDREARQWMADLYRERFVNGKGAAESIREADVRQLAARHRAGKSTHPFHWAAFVAVGEWR